MLDIGTYDRLSKLRLHGFISELQSQEKIGGYEEMSFRDRLDLLIQKETLERENKNLSKRLISAKFKHKVSIEKIKVSASRGLDKSLLQSLSSCDWVKKKLNVIVTGPSGSGKSFLSCAVGEKVCRSEFNVRYYRCQSLLSELCCAAADGTLKNYLNQTSKFHVLIIDDWALSKITETEQKYLFELVEERSEKLSTVFVSQTPVNIWHSLMPNGAIADAIMDRVVHTALRIELKGDSLRKEIDPSLDVDRTEGT